MANEIRTDRPILSKSRSVFRLGAVVGSLLASLSSSTGCVSVTTPDGTDVPYADDTSTDGAPDESSASSPAGDPAPAGPSTGGTPGDGSADAGTSQPPANDGPPASTPPDAAPPAAGGGGVDASASTPPAGIFVDPRDGRAYPLSKIGTATWFGQNLAYAAAGSYCYNDNPANCATYGRLYTFTAATTACPSGSHLPSDPEWKALESALGMPAKDLDLSGYDVVRGADQGTRVKVGGSTGLDVLPAGYRSGTTYSALGDRTYLWTSTASAGGLQALRRRISVAQPTIFRFNNQNTGFAISLRCVVN